MAKNFNTQLKKFILNKSDNDIIEISLGYHNDSYFNTNINLIFFEKILFFFKNNFNDITKKNYYIYYNNNKILLVFDSGSSVSNKIKINSYKILKNKCIHYLCENIINKKISNDTFEPQYEYDNIENIESIIFNYKECEIIFLKIMSKNPKYSIKIKGKNFKHIQDIIQKIENIYNK
jgi:hypothetical protein